MPESADPRVLVIDDDEYFLEIVRFRLEQAGCRVDVASDPSEGLDRAIEGDFDLVILDLMMPGLSGEEVLSLLKPLSLRHKVLVVSAHDRTENWARVRSLGAVGYFQKPVDYKALSRFVGDLLQEQGGKEGGRGRETPVHRLLDPLMLWVLDGKDPTPAGRLVAAGVSVGLLGVLAWLILA